MELPRVPIDVESLDMTVDDLLAAVGSEYGLRVIAAGGITEVLRGSWTDGAQLIRDVCLRFGRSPRNVDGTWVLVPEGEALTYVRWASGRPSGDAAALIGSLALVRSSSIDQSGVAFLGVASSDLDELKVILAGLDSGDDWLVQVTIVDGTTSSTFGVDADLAFDEVTGGWFADGSEVVDSFMITLQSGSERVHSYGAQVPFRTSLVTETGVIVSGGVEYQRISSDIRVEIVESTVGAKIRLGVTSARAGAERDGLFEILSEDIDGEVFIRDEPVLIGSLRRWSTDSTVGIGWPMTFFTDRLRSRRYNVWAHAVRLSGPSVPDVWEVPVTPVAARPQERGTSDEDVAKPLTL